MPIKIPNQLPATHVLTEENIFVMTETRARTQDIRPLQILLLNVQNMRMLPLDTGRQWHLVSTVLKITKNMWMQ